MNLWLEAADSMRRLQGAALETLGVGPEQAAYDVVHEQPGVRLRHYQDAGSARNKARTKQPVFFIVPAPIKQPYIWDMAPDVSVVRHALARGFEVFLVDWTEPNAQTASLGLDDYAGRMLSGCIDKVLQLCPGVRLFLAGHSLGGTFAAIYSALRPEQVAGLVLVEAPLHFGPASGAFYKLLHTPAHASSLTFGMDRVPGVMLSGIAAGAAPGTFQLERQFDLLRSVDSTRDWRNHWRGLRWTLDEFPMSRQLFIDVVEHLYRSDDFMQGKLSVLNRKLGPQQVKAPITGVYNPKSRIVPPAALLEFCDASASQETALVPFEGETGVALQHLAPLIGDQAHATLWPQIFSNLTRFERH